MLAGQKAEYVQFTAVADLVLTVLLFADYLFSHGYVRWRHHKAQHHPVANPGSLHLD